MPQSTSLVAVAVLRREDQVLLVGQQGPGDAKSSWTLPGGVVEAGELLTEALERELLEETGLTVVEIGSLAYAVQVHDQAQAQLDIEIVNVITGQIAVYQKGHDVILLVLTGGRVRHIRIGNPVNPG